MYYRILNKAIPIKNLNKDLSIRIIIKNFINTTINKINANFLIITIFILIIM